MDAGAVISFDDRSGVFDQLAFSSRALACEALRRNGFTRFEDEPGLADFLAPPKPPFHESRHDNGPINSSGQFWTE